MGYCNDYRLTAVAYKGIQFC